MVIKVYVSGISGNKEVKKRQQRVLLILDSKKLQYDVIDIAEPGAEEAKDFMQNNATENGGTISDPNPRHPLPPQIFNENAYCGDYNMFDLANEEDQMEVFLKLEPTSSSNNDIKIDNSLKNGDLLVDEKVPEVLENLEHAANETQNTNVPNEQETADNSLPAADTDAEKEESKEVDGNGDQVGDNADENGKQEEEAETIRETSPEKAEE